MFLSELANFNRITIKCIALIVIRLKYVMNSDEEKIGGMFHLNLLIFYVLEIYSCKSHLQKVF